MNQRLTNLTLILFALITLIACETPEKSSVGTNEKPNIDNLNKQIDQWHQAATDMDADTYFGMMAPESIFIGTDKTENWTGFQEHRNFLQLPWSPRYPYLVGEQFPAESRRRCLPNQDSDRAVR